MSHLALALRPTVVVNSISRSLVPAAPSISRRPSSLSRQIMSTCLTSCLLHPQVHDALSTPGTLVACRTLLGRSFPYASEWSANFLFSLALRLAPACASNSSSRFEQGSLSRLYPFLVFVPSALSLFLRPIANLFRELDAVPGYFAATPYSRSAWDSFVGVFPAGNS